LGGSVNNNIPREIQSDVVRPDFLIVGAGISGVLLSIGLSKKGYNVCLIERDLAPRPRFHGEYLQPYVVNTLREFGLEDVFEKLKVNKVRELRFRDLNKNGLSVMAETLVRYPAGEYAYALPTHTLALALRSHARAVLEDKFIEGGALQPIKGKNFLNKPKFTLKTKEKTLTIIPKYVFGCDGRRSSVREWMGGKKSPVHNGPTFFGKNQFIVGCELNSRTQYSDRYEVVRTMGKGTVAGFSLSEELSRVYWNSEAELGKSSWETLLPQLLNHIQSHTQWKSNEPQKVAGSPADTAWLGPASSGKFFLAGDALAVSNPLGGQGMTSATYHACTLISLFENKKIKLENIATEYGRLSKSWYQRTSLLNFGLFYLFCGRHPLIKFATKHVLRRWNQDKVLCDRVARLFGALDLDTPSTAEIVALWGLIPKWILDIQLEITLKAASLRPLRRKRMSPSPGLRA
jgi:2-polyprenyl-6-methoxyphenol hydroxylase-like FAD-dependent oxidoreductase